MKVRSLILASMNAALVCSVGASVACGDVLGASSCDGFESSTFPFEQEHDMTATQVSAYAEGDGGEAPCKALCASRMGASIQRLDTCTVTPVAAEGGAADAGEEAGADASATASPNGEAVIHVACRGLATSMCEGRRPLGHVDVPLPEGDDLGRWLAAAAHLEAASVAAFEQLAAQLRGWDAPAAFVDRCLDARRDEVRHARVIGRLARRRGAKVPRASRVAADEGMLAAAVQNAREGCAGETWATLLAFWKAEHAQDADVRAAYATIADDEARHAQLAWDLHAWFLGQLSPAAQRLVRTELRAALGRVAAAAADDAAAAPPVLGLGSPAALARVAQDLTSRLRAAA